MLLYKRVEIGRFFFTFVSNKRPEKDWDNDEYNLTLDNNSLTIFDERVARKEKNSISLPIPFALLPFSFYFLLDITFLLAYCCIVEITQYHGALLAFYGLFMGHSRLGDRFKRQLKLVEQKKKKRHKF